MAEIAQVVKGLSAVLKEMSAAAQLDINMSQPYDLIMMRTTIRLDENLLADAKQFANERGQSLTGLIEDALRRIMAQREQTADEPFELVTFAGEPLFDDWSQVKQMLEDEDVERYGAARH